MEFVCVFIDYYFFFFKQKTAYEMRISDWSSDVCSSDLLATDYALLVVVDTLPWLFVARALSGLFGGSYAAAQAAIADVTRPQERARNFEIGRASCRERVCQYV